MKTRIINIFLALILLLVSCKSEIKEGGSSLNDFDLSEIDYDYVKDIDGNIYEVIQIGHQIWMAENLKSTHYNDGTPIPNVRSRWQWKKLNEGAYSWYKNNYEKYGSTYGALYNFYAVNTGKLCPVGWRVPSVSEFKLLILYAGGYEKAGNSLKIEGRDFWLYNNPEVTNDLMFSALPGGYRSGRGFSSGGIEGMMSNFKSIGYNGFWWTSTPYRRPAEHGEHYDFYDNSANDFGLIGLSPYASNYDNHLYSGSNKRYGYSVRCVKRKTN